ncbi:MAG: endolytic transglycosylase MltG [Chloroflexi bacterium]|nr:endolytic transglycosylase MltG [Chloroflexota bacterium]
MQNSTSLFHRTRLPLMAAVFILMCLLLLAFVILPLQASRLYGPPNSALGLWGFIEYSARLLWHDGNLTRPVDENGVERVFIIAQGESVTSVAERLEAEGLVHNGDALRDYLIYKGLDVTMQAGNYTLSPALSIVDIANELQDPAPGDATFVVLPGWRLEEVAASIPTSGLNITPGEFLAVASSHPIGYEFFDPSASSEGFLFPDTYILPRDSTPEELLNALVRNFGLHLTGELREGFARQGLSVYQAVTLASIVEREAIADEEKPVIASVFINRLNAGMKLDSDPTVQYAIGFNVAQQTWWTNPLSGTDLQFISPYNTYQNVGLPPGPIASPGLSALRAVAFPVDTLYFFFQARCDGSGLHNFAETFEQHLSNSCP